MNRPPTNVSYNLYGYTPSQSAIADSSPEGEPIKKHTNKKPSSERKVARVSVTEGACGTLKISRLIVIG